MKEYLFSYGTLQKESVQLELFGRIFNGSPDELKGYEIARIEIEDEAFLSKGEDKYQLTARLSKNKNDSIKGTVFEITSDELLAADKYEPASYKRIKVMLASGTEAWIYTGVETNYLQKLIEDIELHSVEGIKECFSNGIHPNDYYNNQPLIYELISEYTRSPQFKDCVQAFVEYGLTLDDQFLLAVLLDDSASLDNQLRDNPEAVDRKYSLRCAYTPLHEATLLHVCAEFNHVSCAEVLVKHGADINAKAGVDEYGFGGQTPIFHTVNQNSNQSVRMLNYLLSQGADLQITVAGLIWGKGYEWETLIPAVNPISYAMMGLLPQMHRDEVTIAKVVKILLKAAYEIDYSPGNVPCAYLKN